MLLDSLNFLDFLKVFAGLVFAILFLQSGLDKVIDYKGNLAWICSYFEPTPLKKNAKTLFILLTITEICAGLFSLIGSTSMLFFGNEYFLKAGIALTAFSLLFVFTGQRMAKDYTSAAHTISYLAVAMLAWFIASQ